MRPGQGLTPSSERAHNSLIRSGVIRTSSCCNHHRLEWKHSALAPVYFHSFHTDWLVCLSYQWWVACRRQRVTNVFDNNIRLWLNCGCYPPSCCSGCSGSVLHLLGALPCSETNDSVCQWQWVDQHSDGDTEYTLLQFWWVYTLPITVCCPFKEINNVSINQSIAERNCIWPYAAGTWHECCVA